MGVVRLIIGATAEKILGSLMGVVCAATIGLIIHKTVRWLWPHNVREIGKVFHGTNVQNLKQKIQELERVIDDIKRETDEAKRKGEDVLSECSKWVEDASVAKADAVKFLEEKLKGEESCFRPNIYSWYRLGGELIKKTTGIDQLLKRGEKFQIVSSFGSRFPSLDYEDFESRKLDCEEIMKALKDDSRPVIGIYGMGGVGKTAMVKKVGDLAEKEQTFDKVVLAVVSRNPVVRNIQDELANQLGITLQEETVQGRARSLRSRLMEKGKKILVILDDICNQLDLKKIGFAFEDGIKGSKVLLTSRKLNVCRAMQDPNPIFIQQLSDEEAWNLFHKKVGNTIKSHDIPPDLAQQVCRKCGGLPAAILAVAGALNTKDIRIWQNPLNQLNTFNLKEIEGVDRNECASLMVNYNQLENEAAKSCFLFCCLFPEGCDIPIEFLMTLGRGMGILGDMKKLKLGEARNRVYDLVDKLKDFSLLLEGKDKDHVKMHEVVRDVAISIASQGQFLIETGEDLEEWPERETYNSYTAFSLLFKSIKIRKLPEGLKCPKLHTLMLESSHGDFNVPDRFFDGMEKLKVLALKGRLSSSSLVSIENLSDLRVLLLHSRELGAMTWIGKLKRLEMLILRSTNLYKLPIEIGDLTRLRLLDLRGCWILKITSPHVISRLSQLEELLMDFEMCEDLSALMPLSRLESLEIGVPNFEMWPQERLFPFLANLTSFKISINSTLWYGEYGSWKKILKLEDVPLRCGVDVLLKKAEALYISELKDLKDCIMDYGDRESFSDLTCLHAYSCEGVQQFIVHVLERQSHLESFSKLGVLKIEKCNFKYLLSPSAAKVLVQLEELTIKDCENVEAIVGRYEVESTGGVEAEDTVDRVIGFSSLKHLWLGNLPKLVGFYPKMERTSGLGESLQFPVQPLFNEKVAFPELQELKIENAGGWSEIVGLQLPVQGSFSKLRKLTARGMKGLSTIGSSALITRLQSLQGLKLSDCGSLRAVFKAERKEISEGEDIVAIHNEKATSFEVFELPALQSLVILRCGLLEEFCWDSCPRSNEATNMVTPFFSDRVGFPELEELEIENAGGCEEIIGYHLPAQQSFSKLRKLRVENMNGLSTIGSSSTLIPRLKSLQELLLGHCSSLRAVFTAGRSKTNDEAIPVEAFELPALQSLEIMYCSLLEEFCWDSFPRSKEGSEDATNAARPFFSDRVAFPELEEMVIINAGESREIVGLHLPAQESFSKLRVLGVYEMNGLSSIGSSALIRRLQSLRGLKLRDCGSLRAVFKAGRSQMTDEEGIVATEECFEFPALRILKIRDCCSLEEFCWKEPSQSIVERGETSFFHNKVAFPELEALAIVNAGECKEIGLDLPAKGSFSKLRKLLVEGMKGLSTIGSSTLIPRLQSLQVLHIRQCGSLRAVFKAEGRQIAYKEGTVATEECFEFSALRALDIRDCSLLGLFCWNQSSQSIEEPEETTFFHNRIGFPKLRELKLMKMEKVKEIWEEDGIPPPPPRSFCNLTQLLVSECPKLKSVIPAAILPRLHHLEILDVGRCHSVREVIEAFGAGSEEVVVEDEKGYRAFSVLPNLNRIQLVGLPNLENLPWETAAAAAAGGGSVSFPPSAFLAFQCLSFIKIKSCGRLRNLFSSPSTALASLAPHNLRTLEIGDCEEMEEIVSCCSAASSDAFQIIFPKLQFLELKDLPNLTTLCPSGYRLSPGSSRFYKQIENCPKLHASAPESNAIGDESVQASAQSSTQYKLSESFPNLLAPTPQNDDTSYDETDDITSVEGGPNSQASAPQNNDARGDESDDTSINGCPNLQASGQGISSDASRDE